MILKAMFVIYISSLLSLLKAYVVFTKLVNKFLIFVTCACIYTLAKREKNKVILK